MSEPPITPILLCGGSGSRLWPLSRKSFPLTLSILDRVVTLHALEDPQLAHQEPVVLLVVGLRDFVLRSAYCL